MLSFCLEKFCSSFWPCSSLQWDVGVGPKWNCLLRLALSKTWFSKRKWWLRIRQAAGCSMRITQEHDQRAMGAFLNYTERISLDAEDLSLFLATKKSLGADTPMKTKRNSNKTAPWKCGLKCCVWPTDCQLVFLVCLGARIFLQSRGGTSSMKRRLATVVWQTTWRLAQTTCFTKSESDSIDLG